MSEYSPTLELRTLTILKPVYGDTLADMGVGAMDGPETVRVSLNSKVEARHDMALLDINLLRNDGCTTMCNTVNSGAQVSVHLFGDCTFAQYGLRGVLINYVIIMGYFSTK